VKACTGLDCLNMVHMCLFCEHDYEIPDSLTRELGSHLVS
jgi:hypothetical protein